MVKKRKVKLVSYDKKIKVIVFLFLNMIYVNISYGGAGISFLKIGPGARPSGMADSFVAVADDYNSIYYNPAGLYYAMSKELSFTYLDMYQEFSYKSISYITPFGPRGTFGISLNHLDSGEITKTLATPRGFYLGDSGTYRNTNILYHLAVSQKISQATFFGIGIKYITEQIEQISSSGIGFDMGIIKKILNEKISLGLSISNFGKNLKFINEEVALPMIQKIGIAFIPSRIKSFVFTIEIQRMVSDLFLSSGIELIFYKILAIRCGLKKKFTNPSDNIIGINAGIGLLGAGFTLDYAIGNHIDLGPMHRISLSLGFGISRKFEGDDEKEKGGTEDEFFKLK